jgi:two-component system heavy metal sensor histidine kinase CusS
MMHHPAPSIGHRLSWSLALLTFVGLAVVSTIIYAATAMRLRDAQAEALADKARVLGELVRVACAKSESELFFKLKMIEPMRGGTQLSLWRGDGTVLYRDEREGRFSHAIASDFSVPTPQLAGGSVSGRLIVDVGHDAHMLQGLIVTLVCTSLGGAMLTGMAIRWLVRRELRPLLALAAQTRAISPQRLDQRLQLAHPARELRPWIEQFNALMGRLERSYAQLEGFNADVAHELRTPLANLIGQTELALSRERPVESLRDTLVSNLEEMQRLSAMVNDMLFLSHADRGAVARRGEPVSLAALAQQVVEFHEAPLEEAGLHLRVEGDALLPVDESLFKRALSNLLGNATRFAQPGSTVVIGIDSSTTEQVQVVVQNVGEAVDAQALPRLFDRFFRVDAARHCPDSPHHGLGLAIVAAIARMHAGRTLAEHDHGVTRVGFTLAATA